MNPAPTTYRPGLPELAAVTALAIPLVAMWFTDSVAWGAEDFLAMAVLLGGSCLVYRLLTRIPAGRAYRIATGITVIGVLLLFWVNLAVGIIGDEGNPANLMYLSVVGLGFIGAAASRFQPEGMARALFAIAGGMALVALIAIVLRLG
jgi:hypothetical protein